jgi:hypothetical protein
VAIAGFTSGGWLLFRIWYYADLLPNTFYVKHDPDPAQGWHYLVNAFASYHLEVLIVLAVTALIVAHRRGHEGLRVRDRLDMVLVALPVIAYVVRIGGDAMHFRYLAFPFCLLACATAGAFEAVVARSRWVPLALTVVITVASVLMQPPQRGRRPTTYANVIPEDWCARAYYKLDNRVVHGLGLTDPILARAIAPALRPGHKYALQPSAWALATVYRDLAPPGRGTMRKAVEHRLAPLWAASQLDQIEIIERKMDNHHDFGENLSLAFTFIEPLHLDE